MGDFDAPGKAHRAPSSFAQRILAGMRVAANAEIQSHLRAGRTVHGIHNGERISLSTQTGTKT